MTVKSQKELLDEMKRDIKFLQTEKEDIGQLKDSIVDLQCCSMKQHCVYGARWGNKGRGHGGQIAGLHIF